jgi:metal-sulfur cluster biosynthetic enzyme
MISRADIEIALGVVYDPCSVQASAPLSVIDMGLVTRIDIDAQGAVRIFMRATSPWCTMLGCIMETVEATVRKIDGVSGVVVEVDNTTTWSENDLTAEGAAILGGVRARSRAAVPVRRRQWQERAAKSPMAEADEV